MCFDFLTWGFFKQSFGGSPFNIKKYCVLAVYVVARFCHLQVLKHIFSIHWAWISECYVYYTNYLYKNTSDLVSLKFMNTPSLYFDHLVKSFRRLLLSIILRSPVSTYSGFLSLKQESVHWRGKMEFSLIYASKFKLKADLLRLEILHRINFFNSSFNRERS